MIFWQSPTTNITLPILTLLSWFSGRGHQVEIIFLFSINFSFSLDLSSSTLLLFFHSFFLHYFTFSCFMKNKWIGKIPTWAFVSLSICQLDLSLKSMQRFHSLQSIHLDNWPRFSSISNIFIYHYEYTHKHTHLLVYKQKEISVNLLMS